MKSLSRRRSFGNGFVAGLAAGAVASGVMLFLSTTLGGLSLPEAFGSELTALIPPQMFVFLHQLIGGDAKLYLFYIIVIGQCLVFGLSGALYNRWANPENRPLRWGQGLILAFILWLFSGLVLLPLTGSGVFGGNLRVGLDSGVLSLGLVGIIFGLLFVFCQRWLTTLGHKRGASSTTGQEEGKEIPHSSRRRLLKQGAITAAVVVVGVGLWRFIVQGVNSSKVPVAQLLHGYQSKISPPPTPNYGEIQPAPFLSSEVTSNDQYYVVSKNFTADPTVSAQEWSLQVDGLVEHPYTLSYQELLALPTQQQYESMECISNDVGGSYMSNALWEGVRLTDLLQRAGGVRNNATKVVLHAYDDYVDSIHLSKALEPTTLVATHMNGVPLPNGHGFPARVLVPGIYGMKHVKWLTHIEIVNYDFQGYWQQRGWSDPAPVRLTSRIDTPLDGSSVSARSVTYIAGVAFAGNQGISEVNVSVDKGQTWQRATLKRPLSQLTWVLWELSWQPKPGTYIVTVRAIDLAGNVQNPMQESTLPNGASGYHSISVTVTH
jgi:DMSO/TMAO reductase YedYZ molybdopterin-dependent catalytic subunit